MVQIRLCNAVQCSAVAREVVHLRVEKRQWLPAFSAIVHSSLQYSAVLCGGVAREVVHLVLEKRRQFDPRRAQSG